MKTSATYLIITVDWTIDHFILACLFHLPSFPPLPFSPQYACSILVIDLKYIFIKKKGQALIWLAVLIDQFLFIPGWLEHPGSVGSFSLPSSAESTPPLFTTCLFFGTFCTIICNLLVNHWIGKIWLASSSSGDFVPILEVPSKSEESEKSSVRFRHNTFVERDYMVRMVLTHYIHNTYHLIQLHVLISIRKNFVACVRNLNIF